MGCRAEPHIAVSPLLHQGQRKKSNLKKYREELQLLVAGWFKGRAGRARPRGCRGRLLGGWALAICRTDARLRGQGHGRSVASPPCTGDFADGSHAARAGSWMDTTLGAATIEDGDGDHVTERCSAARSAGAGERFRSLSARSACRQETACRGAISFTFLS